MFITEEDDEVENCRDIPQEVCTSAPQNFFLNSLNGMSTKLADQLASPGLVLPWFLDALGVPTSLIGLLSPIRRAGALLPQLVVSGRIRQLPLRKWFWMAGGAGFGIALILMIPSALLLTPLSAGILVLFLLALGSIARGFSSVAFKDVLAKTIPQGNRGKLLALRATLGGILALIAGLLLRTRFSDQAVDSITPYLVIIGFAGGFWLGSVIFVYFIHEKPGAVEESRNILQELKAGLRVLRRVPGFRKFVATRGVLLSIELSLPFFALYARRSMDSNAGALGGFVAAASISSLISSPFWGRFADQTSRYTMVLSAGMAALGGVMILVLEAVDPIPKNIFTLALPVVFLGLGIAGVRLGRKTYFVDGAPSGERPLYAAISNTISGMLILLGGAFGLVADRYGITVLISILTILAVLGMIVSWWLPEAEHMVSS
jgi:MFS family permease